MRRATLLWALFGFDGRVNREVYWLGNIGMGIIMLLVADPQVNSTNGAMVLSPLTPIAAIPVLWTEIALAVKRLHDRNLSGWIAIVLAIPFINFVAFFIIGLLPGDAGPNPFGRATNTRG